MRLVAASSLTVIAAIVLVTAAGVPAGWSLAIGIGLELLLVGILSWMQMSKERF